jgi:LysR family transcriptional regulator, hydrogen peroxide-inducible genes activator
MNLRDLKYLVALAEHRHFGRAAEASFVSQPTLSAQIRKLEDQLGVQLIERTSRGALLTRVGAKVAERARAVLGEIQAMKDLARAESEPESGTLVLGVFPTLAPYYLPHVVPLLRARFPRLQLYLVEEKTDELLARLERGDLDAAVLAQPIDNDALASEFLFEEPFVFATPRAQHAQGQRTLRSEELKDQHLLLLEEGHCLRQQALDVCERVGAAEEQGFRATSLETLRQMVAAGMGSTLLPLLATRPPVAANPDVAILRFRGRVPSRSLALFWRRTSARSEFLAQVAGVLADLPEGLLKEPG